MAAVAYRILLLDGIINIRHTLRDAGFDIAGIHPR
jgi:hypothetical protein